LMTGSAFGIAGTVSAGWLWARSPPAIPTKHRNIGIARNACMIVLLSDPWLLATRTLSPETFARRHIGGCGCPRQATRYRAKSLSCPATLYRPLSGKCKHMFRADARNRRPRRWAIEKPARRRYDSSISQTHGQERRGRRISWDLWKSPTLKSFSETSNALAHHGIGSPGASSAATTPKEPAHEPLDRAIR